MVTTRILPLIARTMPITNAGVVTVQFSFFPCNYMQLTDIQYQNLKSSLSNPFTDRNRWTKGMRAGEKSNYWGVQETFPYSSSSSSPLPWMWWAGPTKAGICPADACLPAGPENPLFSFVPLIRRHVKKKKKQMKKISGGDWVNKFSPTVHLKRTLTLPPQS